MIELQSKSPHRRVFTCHSQLKWASMFDAFVHIDAEDLKWVYIWRLEAEVKLRIEKGSGMTDEQVKKFVDGCEFRSLRCPYFRGSISDGFQIIQRTSCIRKRFEEASSMIRVGS